MAGDSHLPEQGPAGDEHIGKLPVTDSSGDTLYVFYDLEICTVTFDFFSFLLRAEMFRKAHGFDRMAVVFVPGSNDGFRMMHLSGDVSRWRMRNIHIPGCSLLKSVCGVTNCIDRAQAARIEAAVDGAIFPEGYTTRIVDSQFANEAMIDAFMFAGLVAAFVKGADIPVLVPSDLAKDRVRKWLDDRCDGRRPVVITLRESRYDPIRNSNFSEWVKFAGWLDPEKYVPIFVRDTDAVFEPLPEILAGFEICEEASVDIHIRVALYEAAYVNMLVNNGPMALCYLNPKIRYLVYKFFVDGQSEAAKATFAVYGIPMHRQTPMSTPAQRNGWNDDTFANLASGFSELSALIDEAEHAGRQESLQVRQPMSVDEAFESAVVMHSVGRANPASAIYEHLLATNPDRGDILGMLGLARHHQGRDVEALEILEKSVELDGQRTVNLVNLGIVHRSLGNLGAAIKAFETALMEDPTIAEAHRNIGDIHAEEEEWRQAVGRYAMAVELGLRDEALLRAFGGCLEALGNTDQAYVIYRRAVDDTHLRQKNMEAGLLSSRPELESVYSNPHPYLILPRAGRDLAQRNL